MVGNSKGFRIGLGTFDLVKGLAIVLTVLAHMTSHYNMESLHPLLSLLMFLTGIVGVCCNAMFFVVSGFGLKVTSPGKMLKKTFSELLKPYLIVTLAVAVIYPVVHLLQYQKGLVSAIRASARWVLALLFGLHDPLAEQKIIFGIEVRACWVAWFLLAMFVALNLLNLILKAKKTYVQFTLVMLSVLCGYMLSCVDFTYFCIPQGLITVGYCYIGYIFKKHKLLERKAFLLRLCMVLIPITLIEFLWGECSLAYNTYKNGLVDIIASGCAGVLLFVLGGYAGQYELRILDPLKQIGIYTYWIMCIHSVELICFPWDKITKSMPNYPFAAFLTELELKIVLFSGCCIALKKVMLYKYRRMTLQKS